MRQSRQRIAVWRLIIVMQIFNGIISGEEEIDTVSRTGLEADEEYDEKRDVAFWKEPEEMCQSILTTGSYAVLPPSIAHKPQMRAGKEACHVKKCVAKVKWQA